MLLTMLKEGHNTVCGASGETNCGAACLSIDSRAGEASSGHLVIRNTPNGSQTINQKASMRNSHTAHAQRRYAPDGSLVISRGR